MMLAEDTIFCLIWTPLLLHLLSKHQFKTYYCHSYGLELILVFYVVQLIGGIKG